MVNDQNILKDMFAMALLRQPNNPFGAACEVFGMDSARALRCSAEWVSDPYVLSRQAELLSEFGEEHFMPGKLTLARRVWELAETLGKDTKDRIKAYELYANIRGFIEKQTAIANVTNIVNQNRVMYVKDHGTDQQWETVARDQQMKLIENARN